LADLRDTLDELERTYKAPEKIETVAAKADIFNAAHYSTGDKPTIFLFVGEGRGHRGGEFWKCFGSKSA
jgi:hypothetical protein